MDMRYGRNMYLLRKKFFKIFGATFNIFEPESGALVLHAKQKAFKLREDIRVFGDEAKSIELLTIKARSMLDISAVYDVVDAQTQEPVGALQRRGIKSMIRDEWVILNAGGAEIGMIQEDSTAKALVRRFLFNLLPQSFTSQIGGQTVAMFHQNWNFFVPKIRLDFSMDAEGKLDRRLGLAAAILLAAIEGRQR